MSYYFLKTFIRVYFIKSALDSFRIRLSCIGNFELRALCVGDIYCASGQVHGAHIRVSGDTSHLPIAALIRHFPEQVDLLVEVLRECKVKSVWSVLIVWRFLAGPTGRGVWPDEVKGHVVTETGVAGVVVREGDERKELVSLHRSTWGWNWKAL